MGSRVGQLDGWSGRASRAEAKGVSVCQGKLWEGVCSIF